MLGLLGALVLVAVLAPGLNFAAVAVRLILFLVPLIGGVIAFPSLRRAVDRSERPDLCDPAPTR